MNKVLVTFVLALTAFSTTTVIAQGGGASAQPGQDQPANKKQIQDQAEYNAYIAALNTQDPAQKAAAMADFLNQYPKSVVRLDAQEQEMAAYQAANNAAKVMETARTILQENPNHIRARAIVTAYARSSASNGDSQALKESCDDSEKGLQALPAWPKPEDMAEAEFEKLKNQMADIFNGAKGFCALQSKDFAGAKNYYLKAVQLDPNSMQDVFQLSIALLEGNPIDLNGFWYAAKAINLAGKDADTIQKISGYAKARYKNYTGNVEGWDQMVAAAATQSAPPTNIATSIKRKLTPCEIAVEAVKNNDPSGLSFSDWEFVLAHAPCSPANKDAADKVWQAILDKQKNGETNVKLKLPVLVIASTKRTLQAAITDENQQAKKADLTVNLEKPVLHPPAAGSTVDIVGALSNYTPDPFMFTMEKGDLPGAKPAVKKTVHHAQAGHKRKA
jgi:tetratricopeptide (TPR) repeat protein